MLQSGLYITSDKYLVRVLVVLLHACFSATILYNAITVW